MIKVDIWNAKGDRDVGNFDDKKETSFELDDTMNHRLNDSLTVTCTKMNQE